jgi:hypothetical protein
MDGGGRRVLFRQERAGSEGDGRQARVHSQSIEQELESANASRRSAGSAMVKKWRTGCEGASASSSDATVYRCRYKAEVGMQRWVALAVISDNLIRSVRQ